MMKMYDLNTHEEMDGDGKIKQGVPGPMIDLSSKDVPELSDYKVGDTVEMHVMAKVRSMDMPEASDKPGEKEMPAKTMMNDKTSGAMTGTENVKCKLEINSVGIENITPERKKANERGIDKETSAKIDAKRSAEKGY